MIRWLFSFLLIFPLSALAIHDSTRDDICLEAKFVYGGVRIANSHYILGKLYPGPGVNARMSFRIVSGFSFGMGYSLISSKIDKERMSTDVYAHYHLPGYYTTVSVVENQYNFSSFSFFVKHNFHLSLLEVEPYIQFGFPWRSQEMLYGEQFEVRSKKMNSNITNTSTVDYINNGGSEFGIGLSISKKLYENLYCTFDAGYNMGRIKYIVDERVTDVYGNDTHNEENSTTPYSAWQLRTGIQIRFKYKDMEMW